MSTHRAPPCQPPRAPCGLVTPGRPSRGTRNPLGLYPHASPRASWLTSACSGKGEGVAGRFGTISGYPPSSQDSPPPGTERTSRYSHGETEAHGHRSLAGGWAGLLCPILQTRGKMSGLCLPCGTKGKRSEVIEGHLHMLRTWGVTQCWGHRDTRDLM